MTARDTVLLERLGVDLIGPAAEDELIGDRPSDRYLTGILYPQKYEVGPEEDDDLGVQDDEQEAAGSAAEDESIGLVHAMRPASAGLSFAITADDDAGPSLNITVSCGTYTAVEPRDDDSGDADDSEGEQPPRRRRLEWQRTSHHVTLADVSLPETSDPKELTLEEHGLPGMGLFIKTSNWGSGWLVTVAMVNQQEILEEDRRRDIEEKTFFQTRLEINPGRSTRIRSRPAVPKGGEDGDVRAANLLYRNAAEFAVGHTCSAGWEAEGNSVAEAVYTAWLPRARVARTSSSGHRVFDKLRKREDGLAPLSTGWLSSASVAPLVEGLSLLPEAYDDWIGEQRARASSLPEEFAEQASDHIAQCEQVAEGMREGIQTLREDHQVLLAFQLANKAMEVQRRWLHPDESAFSWRPFQLGFLLLSLPSLARQDHPGRKIMDLLWFPTGGGKTEAYLALIAFTLFHRRLRFPENPDNGAGVAVIMRYTLRLLTAQQFQRASALILACENLRRGNELPVNAQQDALGSVPFSIGLWVGSNATPNTVKDAAEVFLQGKPHSPAQLEDCPACGTRLHWRPTDDLSAVEVRCTNASCPLGSSGDLLPVWTVDEDVYRETPSLVIGTIDKFAQIVRRTETGRLFGRQTPHPPPELIIQDELHLITGPLGTMAGAYEIAVDRLCSEGGTRPKIIGSTATIRRAEPQIKALFNRRTRQFPPPGLDASDSAFGVLDTQSPDRLYVGVTTAGRSAKFALQAVSASLLQSASVPAMSQEERDAYWTLVAYFNSLRELGGALVLMQDDVGASLQEYAERRSEVARDARIVDELTSRVSQIEIRDKLQELTRGADDANAIDVLLASNMISVGVDVPRLGLMVVNGQPKAIAEYIQATSRVGRGGVGGLIVTLYNNAKARDRSHYETFATWHSTLYREVEASSVTPFASRARDRTLHAPLVAMVRHLEAEMRDEPVLSADREQAVRKYAELIVARARDVDADEVDAVRAQLEELIEMWSNRAPLKDYWNDYRTKTSLLIGAEKAAARRAAGRLPAEAWPTPNSLRNVDPGTPFVVVERLRPDSEED